MKVLRALRRHGVLGINRRNAEYTLRWNPRAAYPVVDDKLLTKKLCARAGIPTPRLLAVAHHHFELRHLRESMARLTSFVLKPGHGAMGNGILVIRERDGAQFQLAGGRSVALEDLVYHAAGVISGLYALAGQTDAAIVEERLLVHPDFAAIASEGVPDVRVIVYRGVPVMAMTRLPTLRAGGRANLHQGAVAAGIDLESGRTTHAILQSRPIRKHPDTGEALLGRAIPGFADVLGFALRAADETGLGYVGADLVVDARRGPVLLEMNARPGLMIQLANRAGLLPRLRAVDREITPGRSAAERIALAVAIAIARRGVGMRRCVAAFAVVVSCAVASASVSAQEPTASPASSSYDVRYEVRIVPTEKTAHVAVHVTDPANVFRSLRFRVDPERQLAFRGDGHVVVEEASVAWTPPRGGGVLRYAVRIDHLRDESSYDARCTRSFALLRGDDLVPRARVRTEGSAQSKAVLQLVLPQGWSAVLPYARLDDDSWSIERPERRFDRPVGWLLLGRLGVLRERVAGVRVAIGAPVGNGMRRQDLLALLRWTLPALSNIAPLPDRLALVGAADPMWRGGLSAPKSAYLHASLPLIGEDATSPVLHEVIHVLLRARAGPGGDWAVEGLAELYSLEALVRSKTISKRRYERGLERIAEKGRGVKRVTVSQSTSATTARAVVLLRELDQEIRRASDGRKNLDDVVRALVEAPQAISLVHFRAVSERVAGASLATFFDRSELAPTD